MRYCFPILIVLGILNLYSLMKPVYGGGNLAASHMGQVDEPVQTIHLSREYRFSIEKDMELLKARDEILALKEILQGYMNANTHQLRLSAYTARPQECNADVKNTALMQKPQPGWTVAVSRDLKGWLGKRVYIEGFGVRLVNDLMNSRYSKSIDILVGNVPAAKKIGVRQGVLVTLIEPLAMESETNGFDLVAWLDDQHRR